ncbi:MAG: hypothetical protein ACTSV7_00850 [Candidatus Baldrarchaeia archaeon]
MTSRYEILEYVRVNGRVRWMELFRFSKARKTLQTLLSEDMLRRVRVGPKEVYIELGPSAYHFLKKIGSDSFIDGNPYAERMERILGRRFWRPGEDIKVR